MAQLPPGKQGLGMPNSNVTLIAFYLITLLWNNMWLRLTPTSGDIKKSKAEVPRDTRPHVTAPQWQEQQCHLMVPVPSWAPQLLTSGHKAEPYQPSQLSAGLKLSWFVAEGPVNGQTGDLCWLRLHKLHLNSKVCLLPPVEITLVIIAAHVQLKAYSPSALLWVIEMLNCFSVVFIKQRDFLNKLLSAYLIL